MEVGASLFIGCTWFSRTWRLVIPSWEPFKPSSKEFWSGGEYTCVLAPMSCFWNWYCQIVPGPDRLSTYMCLCTGGELVIFSCWLILGVPYTCGLSEVCGGVPCCFARLRWIACVARGLAIYRLSLVASSRSLCSTSHWACASIFWSWLKQIGPEW